MDVNRIYCFDGFKMVSLSPMEATKAHAKAKDLLAKLDKDKITVGADYAEDAAYFRHKAVDFLVSASGRVWHQAMHLDYEAVPKQLQREVWAHMKQRPDHKPGNLRFYFFPRNGMRFGMCDGELQQPTLMVRSPLVIWGI